MGRRISICEVEGRRGTIGEEQARKEQISESEISMVLNTFMYLDYKEAADGETLKQIVEELAGHPDYGGGGIHYGEYTVLREAVRAEEIGSLEIGYQSVNMGYDVGTAACTFTSPDKEMVYVVYRGTGDGEWPDNGLGMTEASTVQQEQALAYFEEAVTAMGVSEEQRLVVTGHSKGGNKAQFVTMETKYDSLVDVCYSVDGQGFSEAAITGWQQEYGAEGFHKRTEKIYGIYGENDYVSVLGNSIIDEERVRYIQTPVNKENFAGYHDIKYMFATLEYDESSGEYVNVFHGRKNSEVTERGKLGEYAAVLSAQMMDLPVEQRDGCAAVVMQLMEMTRGTHEGINGERITLKDVGDFLRYGIPMIADSLLRGDKGRELLLSFGKNGYLESCSLVNIQLKADADLLLQSGNVQKQRAAEVRRYAEEIQGEAERIPGYLKGGTAIYHQMKLAAARLDRLGERLQSLGEQKTEIARRYKMWESKAVEEVQSMIDFSAVIG